MKKSKFFRVATEGATTDGRNIERTWLTQIANNFDPKKYSPRVWLEHIRGLLPDSQFKAYGDVVAVEAREVEDGKIALFAQIEPTEELIQINKARQKLFTSIEVNPNFANTNEAYLVGLGVTDSPSSLGTEALAFSAQHGLFDSRKQAAGNVFSVCVETSLELEDEVEDTKISLSDRIKALFNGFRAQAEASEKEDLSEAMTPVVEGIVGLETLFNELKNASQNFITLEQFNTLKADFEQFKTKLESEDSGEVERPSATGMTYTLTDC